MFLAQLYKSSHRCIYAYSLIYDILSVLPSTGKTCPVMFLDSFPIKNIHILAISDFDTKPLIDVIDSKFFLIIFLLILVDLAIASITLSILGIRWFGVACVGAPSFGAGNLPAYRA